jgi:hypothetical protein
LGSQPAGLAQPIQSQRNNRATYSVVKMRHLARDSLLEGNKQQTTCSDRYDMQSSFVA